MPLGKRHEVPGMTTFTDDEAVEVNRTVDAAVVGSLPNEARDHPLADYTVRALPATVEVL